MLESVNAWEFTQIIEKKKKRDLWMESNIQYLYLRGGFIGNVRKHQENNKYRSETDYKRGEIGQIKTTLWRDPFDTKNDSTLLLDIWFVHILSLFPESLVNYRRVPRQKDPVKLHYSLGLTLITEIGDPILEIGIYLIHGRVVRRETTNPFSSVQIRVQQKTQNTLSSAVQKREETLLSNESFHVMKSTIVT